jgi:sugar lactone lactonase YvrE
MREISTVLSDLSYLECPRWHEDRIWVSDFYTHQVLSAREDGSDLRQEAHVPGQPSGLGWLPDGRLLVVSQHDKRLLRREPDGSLVTHADLSAHVTGEPNDMVVDLQGRAFVGNFGFDLFAGAPIASTSVLRVDPDGTVTHLADDLWFPNGSVITDDGVYIVGETFGNCLSAFDIQADGSLANRRVWASFGPRPSTSDLTAALGQLAVAPDGCGLDAEGALWVADALHGRVLRIREAERSSRSYRSARRLRLHARRSRRPHAVPVRRTGLRPCSAQRHARGGAARRSGRRPRTPDDRDAAVPLSWAPRSRPLHTNRTGRVKSPSPRQRSSACYAVR